MARATVKPENSAEAEAAVKKMFSAIQEAQPQGVHYASCRLPDGVTYVALLELDDGIENPLPKIAAWRDFQEALKNWVVEPAVPEQLTVIGSYSLF